MKEGDILEIETKPSEDIYLKPSVVFQFLTKFKINWLKEFALPISMVGAMAGAILFARLLS